jgi:hypothetical protein
MTAEDGLTRVDISEPAENAGYLFNVGDFMLLFSTAAGTTALAALIYGTSEFRPHNTIEAALQVVTTVAAIGYVPLLAWRGYARRYWLGHAVFGSMLVLGILAGIAAVLASGWEWTWTHTIAFVIFVALFLTLAAIPLGFALSATELLTARLPPDGALLTDVVRARPTAPDAGDARGKVRPRIPLIGNALVGIGVLGIAAVTVLFVLYALTDKRDIALAAQLLDLLGGLSFTLPVWAVLIPLGRRLSQPNASRLLEADERAPILLLRSFSDDAKQIPAKGLATRALFLGLRGKKRLEAAVADELARLGPFVAIGRPGEVLPQLGAARAYFGDDEWQIAVAGWIARARLIVMIAGTTSWVQWELREISRAGQIGKLLVLLPPGSAADKRHRLELVGDELGDPRILALGADSSRIIAMRFRTAGDVAHAARPRGMVVESATTGEVDYELAIRVATSGSLAPNRAS